MHESTRTNFSKTLNLPRTGFPMRAALAGNEPTSIARWENARLYETLLAQRAGAEPFVFHDGPPYANGRIHVGQLLNKVLKDFVVRSRLMAGRHCPFVPGWDCHGLPIEHKVMSDLVSAGKLQELSALGEDERRMAVRRACRADAEKYQALQARDLKRLMTMADFDNPYLTMTPDYEKGVLEVFGSLLEQGLVYRALKSVHWSIENRTALAEAELEYEQREDVAVYVDFEAAQRAAVEGVFGVGLEQNPSFMIWTTTPWTLPANLAIAVRPAFRYVLVRLDGNVTVIASELLDTVTAAVGSVSVERLAEVDGAALVGLTYRHPFCDRVCPIVEAAYVTLTDGTGLVHTAPGHGTDDNLTALREGLEIYCPVRGDGTYDETVPRWLVGMSIWEANPRIVEHLRESGHLVHSHTFVHSYPHDWRSKKPVIFRATEQWFIGVDRKTTHGGRTLRELALAACESATRFYPEWGRNRMRGMLQTRPDWCLSRQRAWGLPIPAFELPDGEILLTPRSVRAIAEVFGAHGSDAWFTEKPEDLLAAYDPADDPDAPATLRSAGWGGWGGSRGKASGLKKMYDIFDVWFESGSSWHSVMRQHGRGFPIDLYLEGSDQHRGWFQLSLLPSLGVTGQSPFSAVLTHGFVVDGAGLKMSKSVGNTIEVEDLLSRFGADLCRWWVSSLAYENDIKMDLESLVPAGDTYRKVRNTLRFLLGNLRDFQAGSAALKTLAPTSIDAYVLGRARELKQHVQDAYERYAFRQVHQLLYDFCNETLSAFYGEAVKDRLYCDRPDSPRRRATQAVMYELVELLCRLLAPILPHTADEAYRQLEVDRSGTTERCVHLQRLGPMPEVQVAEGFGALMEVRARVLKALEVSKDRGLDNPLDAGIVLPDPEGVLVVFGDDLADIFRVSRVEISKDAAEIRVDDLRSRPRCERCWRRVETAHERGDGSTLCDRCADALLR